MTVQSTLAATIIENCADAIIAQQINGDVVAWNAAAANLLGYPADEVIGTRPLLTRPAQAEEANELFKAAVAGRATTALTTLRRHRNGRAVAVTLTMSPMMDTNDHVMGVSTILRATSASAIKTQQQLRDLAYRDSLTGLANRAHLLDRLEQAMKRDERSRQYGAVLFIDLDGFKGVNDTAGHRIGDKILMRAAKRMESRLRKCDTVARWGGDEFVVLIEDLSDDFDITVDKSCVIAHKLASTLDIPYQLERQLYLCPASIGLTLFRGTEAPAAEIIDKADRAMYFAKSNSLLRFHIDAVKPQLAHAVQAASAAA